MSDPTRLLIALAAGAALKLAAEWIRTRHFGAEPVEALGADESEEATRILASLPVHRQAWLSVLLLLAPRRFVARMRREIAARRPVEPGQREDG